MPNFFNLTKIKRFCFIYVLAISIKFILMNIMRILIPFYVNTINYWIGGIGGGFGGGQSSGLNNYNRAARDLDLDARGTEEYLAQAYPLDDNLL